MKTFTKNLVLLLIISFVLACNKDNYSPNTSEISKDASGLHNNKLLVRKNVGIPFLNALSNDLFADKVLSEIQQESNPDLEILYAEFFNKSYNEKSTISDFLESQNELSVREDYFNVNILKEDPELDIFIFNPTTYESNGALTKEELKSISKVIIITEDTDEESIELDSYDKAGNHSKISAKIIPTEPTLIIRNNVDLIPIDPQTAISYKSNHYPQIVNLKPKFKSKFYYYYYSAEVLNQKSLILQPRNSLMGPFDDCTRNLSEKYDELYTVQWNTCSNYMARCGFWEGYCRMRVNVAFGTKTGATYGFTEIMKDLGSLTHSKFAKFNIFGSCSYTRQVNISSVVGTVQTFNWDPILFGTPVKYVWFEVDESDITATLNLSPFTATFKLDANTTVASNINAAISISPKNDNLGESFVEYCDWVSTSFPYPNFYNTGSITFQVK